MNPEIKILAYQEKGFTKKELLESVAFMSERTTNYSVYCPHCLKLFRFASLDKQPSMVTAYFARSKHRRAALYRVTCPHCGDTYYVLMPMWAPKTDVWHDENFPKTYMGEKVYWAHTLWNDARLNAGDYYSYSCLKYNTETGAYGVYQQQIVPYLRAKRLFFKVYKRSFWVNLHTGKATFIRGESNRPKSTKLFNCSASLGCSASEIQSFVYLKDLVRCLCAESNVPQNIWDQFYNRRYQDTVQGNGIRELALMLAWRHVPNFVADYDAYNHSYKLRRYSWNTEECAYTKDGVAMYSDTIMDSQEFVKSVCNRYKLPCSKAFRSLYYKDVVKLSQAIMLKRLGITNIDHLLQLLNDTDFVIEAELKKTMQAFMLKKGDSWVVKMMLTDVAIFHDALRMYRQIMEENAELLPTRFWKMSLSEMHDALWEAKKQIRKVNIPIPYKKKDLKLSGVFQDYQFKLAKDTDELYKIGNEMHICVGSYRDLALSGKSKIVSVRHNGKYVACIELNRSINRVLQIKAFSNQMVTGVCAQAVQEWVESNKILTDKCMDYTALENGLNEAQCAVY